jgi:hypothetical protein
MHAYLNIFRFYYICKHHTNYNNSISLRLCIFKSILQATKIAMKSFIAAIRTNNCALGYFLLKIKYTKQSKNLQVLNLIKKSEIAGGQIKYLINIKFLSVCLADLMSTALEMISCSLIPKQKRERDHFHFAPFCKCKKALNSRERESRTLIK